jgi:3-oxoacyl-[acyl-carrier protein] reductase
MELGIKGRKAIVCGSSRGLGKACALALAREGVDVVINGLDIDRLETTAAEIRSLTSARVMAVRADITTEEGRRRLVAASPEADILVNNNAGPKPGRFEDWTQADWYSVLNANMLAAVGLIQTLLPGMRERKFGRVVNILSAMTKSPHYSEMGQSTAARLALMGVSKSVSRSVAMDNVTLNNLLPERFDTDRQKFMAERMVAQQGISMEEARRQIAATIPANRFGRPEEFGDTCAFLCGRNAGFMTGQNIQLDGGAYEGVI